VRDNERLGGAVSLVLDHVHKGIAGRIKSRGDDDISARYD
jgi:hypothetical protein